MPTRHGSSPDDAPDPAEAPDAADPEGRGDLPPEGVGRGEAAARAAARALDVAAAVDQVVRRPGGGQDRGRALDRPALDVAGRVEDAARRGGEVAAGAEPDRRARADDLGDLGRAAVDGDLGRGQQRHVAVGSVGREDPVHPVQPAHRGLKRSADDGGGRHVERDHGPHHRLGVPDPSGDASAPAGSSGKVESTPPPVRPDCRAHSAEKKCTRCWYTWPPIQNRFSHFARSKSRPPTGGRRTGQSGYPSWSRPGAGGY